MVGRMDVSSADADRCLHLRTKRASLADAKSRQVATFGCVIGRRPISSPIDEQMAFVALDEVTSYLAIMVEMAALSSTFGGQGGAARLRAASTRFARECSCALRSSLALRPRELASASVERSVSSSRTRSMSRSAAEAGCGAVGETRPARADEVCLLLPRHAPDRSLRTRIIRWRSRSMENDAENANV